MSELLGALGLAWPRLLLYPGGLFALVASWLLGMWLARCSCGPTAQVRGGLGAVVPPLVALTMLPLAPARSFPYGLDLVVALALLEWPQAMGWGAQRREELARAYAPLLLAGLGLAEACGGLELTRLLRWPEPLVAQLLLGASAALWLAALPRLLASGPGGLAGRLRALGLLLVAALPVLGALAATLAERLPADLAGWLLPPVAMLAAGLALGGVARVPERARARVELVLGVVILGLLAVIAGRR